MHENSQAILETLLVLKCRRGDAQAWRELVQRYERRLFYFLRRMVGNERDAWDLLQQTWLAAVKGLNRLDDPKALRAWLYRIARNNAVSHLRRAGLEMNCLDPADIQELPSEPEEEDCWLVDAAEQLHAALERLSVPHREVITLHFLEDASVEEIASVTGVPPGTVKSRLFYARRALRDELQRRETI